jgi:hypothetical protein
MTMEAVNQRFIDLYVSEASVEVIAREMGWNTKNPKQMVQAKVSRLRKAGYAIPYRGRPQQKMTAEQAQDMIERAFRVVRQNGFLIIHEDRTGKYKVVEHG